MPRWPTPMEETEEATALHDRQMVGAVPDKPLTPESKLWLREQLKKKGIKFGAPLQPESETDPCSKALAQFEDEEQEATQDSLPMSAQQEQDEVIMEAMSAIPDEPTKDSQPSFATGSKGLLDVKSELISRGMSDAEAEEYLRTL